MCTFDHQSFCAVVLCLDVCLLCTRLSTHFSAVHSVVIVCAVDICLVTKISKKTSPQCWRLSFALKRNET